MTPLVRRVMLVPPGVRSEVEEALSGYSLAQIDRIYRSEGFAVPIAFEVEQGRMRRSKVAAYESLIDFTSPDDVSRYLRVVESVLDLLSDTDNDWARTTRERLIRALGRADIVLDDRQRLRLPTRLLVSPSLAGAPSESGIRLAITALERSDAEPEEKIGAAKELVEATVKLALSVVDGAEPPSGDLPELAAKLHRRLNLSPGAIAPTTRGAQTMTRLLGGLTGIPHGLAELRNEGYGTGHGRASRISGIRPRHANLAARAAVAYASFILETLEDPDAPWKRESSSS